MKKILVTLFFMGAIIQGIYGAGAPGSYQEFMELYQPLIDEHQNIRNVVDMKLRSGVGGFAIKAALSRLERLIRQINQMSPKHQEWLSSLAITPQGLQAYRDQVAGYKWKKPELVVALRDMRSNSLEEDDKDKDGVDDTEFFDFEDMSKDRAASLAQAAAEEDRRARENDAQALEAVRTIQMAFGDQAAEEARRAQEEDRRARENDAQAIEAVRIIKIALEDQAAAEEARRAQEEVRRAQEEARRDREEVWERLKEETRSYTYVTPEQDRAERAELRQQRFSEVEEQGPEEEDEVEEAYDTYGDNPFG